MTARTAAERLIVRGGISAGIGFVTRFGARFLFLFVAGQLYGAALFGAFNLAVAVVELAATVGGVGLRKTLFQLLDRNEEDGTRPAVHVVVDGALLVTAVSLSLAAIIASTVALLPRTLIPPNTEAALVLLAPMIAGQALLDLLAASTRWKHVMRYEVASRSFIEPYAAVAAAAAAWYAGLEEIGLLLSYWVATLAALAFSLYGARRAYGPLGPGRYRTSPAALLSMARGTFPNMASDVVNAFFARLDLYLVGLILGERATGLYAMARQLRTPVRQVRQSLDSLLTPIAARTLGVQGPAQTALALASATRLILAVTLPVLLLLIALGEPLLAAFGREFRPAYLAMVTVTAAELIQAAYGLSGLIFVYLQPWLGLRLTALWSAIGVAVGALLIPPLGIEGAAASVLTAYAGMALHRRIVLARRFDVRIPLRHSFGPIVAATLGLAAMILAWELAAAAPRLTRDVAAAVAALAVYGIALWAWVRATGERLSMAGFTADPVQSGAA